MRRNSNRSDELITTVLQMSLLLKPDDSLKLGQLWKVFLHQTSSIFFIFVAATPFSKIRSYEMFLH